MVFYSRRNRQENRSNDNIMSNWVSSRNMTFIMQKKTNSISPRLVRKDMDENERERLSNITIRHKFKLERKYFKSDIPDQMNLSL